MSSKTISLTQWISWMASLLVATVSVILFLYSNFLTKETFQSHQSEDSKYQDSMESRLDRMDEKLDKILLRVK